MSIQKEIDALIAKKSLIQKRQLSAYSMGMSEQIHAQLRQALAEVDIALYTATEIQKAKLAEDDDDEGLII